MLSQEKDREIKKSKDEITSLKSELQNVSVLEVVSIATFIITTSHKYLYLVNQHCRYNLASIYLIFYTQQTELKALKKKVKVLEGEKLELQKLLQQERKVTGSNGAASVDRQGQKKASSIHVCTCPCPR